MSRARNIKPGFFRNEDLAECTPLARLLFVGLWCEADREGRLEDRPKRLKAEVLPYDNCDVDALLNELCQFGFILRYVSGGSKFVQVVNFAKHQNPHCKESESTIPAPDSHQINCDDVAEKAQYKHGASHNQEHDKTGSRPADSLIPDSLIPDSLSPPQASANTTPRKPEPRATRIPDGWSLTTELFDIGRLARRESGLPEIDLRLEAAKFVDFWRAKSGKDATKLDWTATWRNWCRNASAKAAPQRPASPDPIFKTAAELGL